MSTQPSSHPMKGGPYSNLETDTKGGGSLPAASSLRRPVAPVAAIQAKIEQMTALLNEIREDAALLMCRPVPIYKYEPTVREVVGVVCRQWSVPTETVFAKCNAPRSIWPRRAAQYLLRKHTSLTTGEIGWQFRQHHTTVIHGVDRFCDELKFNPLFVSRIAAAEHSLGLREIKQ